MSFKFFRKHQRTMLWVIVVFTVFTFSFFGVTTSMRSCIGRKTQPYGMFTSKLGEEVEISPEMYRHHAAVARLKSVFSSSEGYTADDVFTQIVLYHDALDAGICVPDQEITKTLQQFEFLKTKDRYLIMVKNLGYNSPEKFEEHLREMLMVEKLKGFLRLNEDMIPMEELYSKYKRENEEFKLDFLSFPYERYADKVDRESVTEEELKSFYDSLPESSSEVRDNFSEDRKLALDVAYIDLESVDFEEYADLVKDIEVSEGPLKRHYELVIDRFKVDPGPGEEGEGEAEDKYLDFEEVKPQLENEFKLMKLVENASGEWDEYAMEKGIVGKPVSEAGEPPAKGDKEENKEGSEGAGAADGDKAHEADGGDSESSGEEDEEAADAIEGPEEFFNALIAKYKLDRVRKEEPVPLDELASMERFGSEMLEGRMRGLEENNCAYIAPGKAHPATVCFIRVVSIVKRRKMDLDEVRDLALDHYLSDKRRALAKEDAEAFTTVLEERARELDDVKQAIDRWQESAKEEVEELLEKKGDISDEMAKKIRKDELDKKLALLEPDIDALLQRYTHEFFDDEAEARGFSIGTIDYFDESIGSEQEYSEMEESPEKFLMGYQRIFDLDVDGVSTVIPDGKGESWYVARVLDRRFPTRSSMTEADFTRIKQSVTQQKMIDRMMRQYNPSAYPEVDDPYSFDNLVEQFNIRYYDSDTGEEKKMEPVKKEMEDG